MLPEVHTFGLREVENIELHFLGSCMENIRELANSSRTSPQDRNGNVGNTDSTNNNNLADAQRKTSKSPTRLPRLNRSRSNLQRSAMMKTQCNPRSNSFVETSIKSEVNDTAIQTSTNDIRGSYDNRKHSPSRIPVSSARSRSRSPTQTNLNDLANPSSVLGSRSNPIKPYGLGSGLSSSRIPLKNSYRARTQTYVAGLRASEKGSNPTPVASQNQSKMPHLREETHRPTLTRENSRAQQAFLKVYDSLLSLGNSENGNGISDATDSGNRTGNNGNTRTAAVAAIPDAHRIARGGLSREVSFDVTLDVNPTMSKADFVKGIEDLVGELKRRSELEMQKRIEHKEGEKPEQKVVPTKSVEDNSLKSSSNAPVIPSSPSGSTSSATNNMQRGLPGSNVNASTITKLFFAGTMIMLLIGIVRHES